VRGDAHFKKELVFSECILKLLLMYRVLRLVSASTPASFSIKLYEIQSCSRDSAASSVCFRSYAHVCVRGGACHNEVHPCGFTVLCWLVTRFSNMPRIPGFLDKERWMVPAAASGGGWSRVQILNGASRKPWRPKIVESTTYRCRPFFSDSSGPATEFSNSSALSAPSPCRCYWRRALGVLRWPAASAEARSVMNVHPWGE